MTGVFTVLCIQRNNLISDVLSVAVHNSGMFPVIVSDMDTAVSTYKTEKPDVIVMDFTPGNDEDYSFISEVRRKDFNTPIIALSMEARARADASTREMCISCITQPFTVTEILKQLEDVRECKETDTLC